MKSTETLDGILLDSGPKNNLAKRMTAYIICWLGISISLLIFNLRDINTILGLTSLLIATAITFKYLKAGVIFFFLVLLASTFDIVGFFPVKVNISFFNISMLSVLLIHSYLNQDIILPVTQDLSASLMNTDNPSFNTSAVNRFKIRFENYSPIKLQEIIDTNKFVPEAIQAAKELLQENYSSEIN